MTLQALTIAQLGPQMFLLDDTPKRLDTAAHPDRPALRPAGWSPAEVRQGLAGCRAAPNWVNDTG